MIPTGRSAHDQTSLPVPRARRALHGRPVRPSVTTLGPLIELSRVSSSRRRPPGVGRLQGRGSGNGQRSAAARARSAGAPAAQVLSRQPAEPPSHPGHDDGDRPAPGSSLALEGANASPLLGKDPGDGETGVPLDGGGRDRSGAPRSEATRRLTTDFPPGWTTIRIRCRCDPSRLTASQRRPDAARKAWQPGHLGERVPATSSIVGQDDATSARR